MEQQTITPQEPETKQISQEDVARIFSKKTETVEDPIKDEIREAEIGDEKKEKRIDDRDYFVQEGIKAMAEVWGLKKHDGKTGENFRKLSSGKINDVYTMLKNKGIFQTKVDDRKYEALELELKEYKQKQEKINEIYSKIDYTESDEFKTLQKPLQSKTEELSLFCEDYGISKETTEKIARAKLNEIDEILSEFVDEGKISDIEVSQIKSYNTAIRTRKIKVDTALNQARADEPRYLEKMKEIRAKQFLKASRSKINSIKTFIDKKSYQYDTEDEVDSIFFNSLEGKEIIKKSSDVANLDKRLNNSEDMADTIIKANAYKSMRDVVFKLEQEKQALQKQLSEQIETSRKIDSPVVSKKRLGYDDKEYTKPKEEFDIMNIKKMVV